MLSLAQQTLHRLAKHHTWTMTSLTAAMADLSVPEVIDILHVYGSVTTVSQDGTAPIVAATDVPADTHALALVRALIDAGASPNTVSGRADTPLDRALRRPTLVLARWLLSIGASPNPPHGRAQPTPDTTWIPPLHTALIHGAPGAVELLLEHQADPNMLDMAHRCVLEDAVRWGRLNEVNALLAAGAHADALTPDGESLLHLAALLPGYDPNGNVWWNTTPTLPEAMIETLAKHGADPHALDDRGRSPLHHAVNVNLPGTRLKPKKKSHARGPIVNASLDHDDVQFRREKAWEQRRLNASALLRAGSDPNLRDQAGHSVLNRAVQHPPYDWGLITALIEAGADWHDQAPHMPTTPHERLWKDAQARGLEEAYVLLVTRVERCKLESTMITALKDQPPPARPRSRL